MLSAHGQLNLKHCLHAQHSVLRTGVPWRLHLCWLEVAQLPRTSPADCRQCPLPPAHRLNLNPEHLNPKPWRPQVVAPYRAQTYALRRRLVNSTPLDRSRLIGSYIQVAHGNLWDRSS
jgi:hypothetical protein